MPTLKNRGNSEKCDSAWTLRTPTSLSLEPTPRGYPANKYVLFKSFASCSSVRRVNHKCMFKLNLPQEKAELLLLRYSQRWAKEYLRHRLDWSLDDSYNTYNSANPSFGAAPSSNYPRPRHLFSALCLCQFIEDYLRNKPRKDPRSCCCSCDPLE